MTAAKRRIRRWSGTCLTAGGQVVKLDVVAFGSYVGLYVDDHPPVWLDRSTGDLLASNVLKAITYALGGEAA